MGLVLPNPANPILWQPTLLGSCCLALLLLSVVCCVYKVRLQLYFCEQGVYILGDTLALR